MRVDVSPAVRMALSTRVEYLSVRTDGFHYRPFVFSTLLVSDSKFTCAASIATDDKEKIQAPAQICHFEHSVRSHYIDGTDSADTRIAAVYS